MKPVLLAVGLLILAGCDAALTVNLPTRPDAPPVRPTITDTATGAIAGRVRWSGERPTFAPIAVYDPIARSFPNPRNARLGADGALDGAVVYLRNVPNGSHAWPHSAIAVEVDADGLHFRDGTKTSHTAFVRVGDRVALRSSLDSITGVRARGSEFFTAMLPKRGDETIRSFTHPGRVELTSASGQFWACLDLFVCEHPFYTKTDANGSFAFADVPIGEYEIVCWHPNWQFVGHERDPETGVIVRKRYAPPLEHRQTVRVEVGQTVQMRLSLE